MSPQEAVDSFRRDELENGGEEERECGMVADALIVEALSRWQRKGWAADNISVMIVFFFEMEQNRLPARSSC